LLGRLWHVTGGLVQGKGGLREKRLKRFRALGRKTSGRSNGGGEVGRLYYPRKQNRLRGGVTSGPRGRTIKCLKRKQKRGFISSNDKYEGGSAWKETHEQGEFAKWGKKIQELPPPSSWKIRKKGLRYVFR